MSRTDNPEALPLEQKCIKPGLWLIEGHEVERYPAGTLGRWWRIKDVPPGPGRDHRTLTQARDWIREHQ